MYNQPDINKGYHKSAYGKEAQSKARIGQVAVKKTLSYQPGNLEARGRIPESKKHSEPSMPALISEQRPPGSLKDVASDGDSIHLRIVEDFEYPAMSFAGYSEKPLSEQLEPIAVVGMGCRLPGDVNSPPEFWEMMMNKETGQTPKVPSSRFNIDAHFHSNNERPGSFNVLGGYFLNSHLREFDPTLFGISPIEAMWMDPQQRKLLEVVYEAFESGGQPLNSISGSKVGCFVGSFTSDFQQMSMKEPDFRHSYAITGVDPGIISNRINYVFNLTGPSSTVNTACSSSLYALHEACNALRNDECSAAVVGGTNLVLAVDQHMNTAKIGVLSPTSTCHTFDESADGYGRADGIAAIYLKQLKYAIRDGDPIRALIRSSSVNSNGGAPAVGISHPSLEGQEAVIRHAYERGGYLDPRLTGYFECHGTGTPVGDPLEVHALANAMNQDRSPGEEPLWIGAVKTNIGHSEAASGVSAVIKAVLALERGTIPPTRGVVKLNPKIAWEDWKVCVANDPIPFPEKLPVKRVSVNSFGYGGTNAHVIIEEADSFLPFGRTYTDSHRSKDTTIRRTFDCNRPFLLLFSAHDKITLKNNIATYGRVAVKYDLLDLSYTLANRRTCLPRRAFLVVSQADLQTCFDNNAETFGFAEKKRARTVGFAFTGQGAQYAKMGSELMAYYPSFLASIRGLDRVLGDLVDGPDWTLEGMLLEASETSRVNEAEFSQPLCTAIQLAIVQLLDQWGIQPAVTVGHSSGEIGAAFAAGKISAAEAIIVAYYRGKVVCNVNTDGAMMSVGLSAENVEPYLEDTKGKVMIACHNSPSNVTLSGDADALDLVKIKLDTNNIFARLVKTGGKAYHSPHMKPVAANYAKLIRLSRTMMHFDSPQSRNAIMVSSVTNSKVDPETSIDEQYWSANLCSPVLFSQAVQTIATDSQFANVDLLIEIGPHSALSGPIRQICGALGFEKLGYLPTLLRGKDSAAQLLKTAGELFLRDYPLDTERISLIEETLSNGKLHVRKGSVIVDLPTYQWNYAKDFWMEPRRSREHRAPRHARHDLLGARVPGGSINEPLWRNVLRIRDVPWLQHHCLGDEAVFPAAGYFSMAIEAITQLNEDSVGRVEIYGYVLRNVSISTALIVPDNDTGIEIVCSMRSSLLNETSTEHTWWDFNISSISEAGHGKDHIAGSIAVNVCRKGQIPKRIQDFPQRKSGKAWYKALKEVGFDYGETFQDMTDIHYDGKNYSAACRTIVKSTSGIMDDESRHVLHPSTVDSCLQLIIVSIYAGRLNDMTCGAVPIQVDEVAIWVPTAEQLNKSADVFSWTDQRGIRSFVTGSQLTASDGELLMDITNMRCTSYEAAMPPKADKKISSQPYGEMVWMYDIDSINLTSDLVNITIDQLFELAVYKNPVLKIIEIGSEHAAAILSKWELLDYTGTETSIEAVDEMSLVLQEWTNAQAQELDISRSLGGQTAAEGSFDLLIRSSRTLNSTELERMRYLLKPGGHAILEISGERSIEMLRDAGFSAIDLIIRREDKPDLALCTAVPPISDEVVHGKRHEVQLVYRKKPNTILSEVKKAFETLGWKVTANSLEQHESKAGAHVVLLADFEGPLLATLEEKELAAIQNITSTTSLLLWVSCGGLLMGKMPEYAMTIGLARSVASEQSSLDLTVLDFDLENTSSERVINIITNIAQRQSASSQSRESEYYVSNGLIYISRLMPNVDLNRRYAFDKEETKSAPFESGVPLIGKIQSGKIVFQPDVFEEHDLEPEHVEVRVSVAGVNKEDTLVIGGSDYPTTFSHEIGGIIQRVGQMVVGLEVGDHVFGFSFNKFATVQRVSADLVQKIEEGEVMLELAGLPMAYSTALYGLKNLAKLEPKECVLVLNGTGSAGLAAIKVTQYMDAIPYVAVSTDAEASMIMKDFGLDERQVLMTSELSIIAQLKISTGGRGPDVIFSSGSVNHHVSREAWRYIEPLGRLVESGRKNVLKRTVLDTIPLNRGASYLSFDILDLYSWKPQTLGNLLRLTTSLYRRHLITPLSPLNLQNLSEINTAVSSFSDEFAAGKTLISYEPSDKPLNVLNSRPQLSLRADATYLLVGCLGGLGRSLTSWMMKKGARRFAFLSRSGTNSKQAQILVKDIEAKGVKVQAIKGDVTVMEDVERALKDIPTEYPIRGVVQAAMVLKDGLFQSMSYSNWIASTGPKVKGTMNLHRALKATPLDFFVMTSSVSGILGTPGQSNYAAANTFLDSLARHRLWKGQKAVSLILSMVLDVGYIAEHLELEENIKRKGIYGIDEEHLLDSFEVSITVQQGPGLVDHIVLGMDPEKLQKTISESSATDAFWIDNARFKALAPVMNSITNSNAEGSSGKMLSTVRSAATPADAIQLISNFTVEKLSRLLLLEPGDFEPDVKSIAEYGLDSMIGVELRNWIFKELGLDVPFQQLLDPSLTITKLAAQVCANPQMMIKHHE
ncbi:hypothetical protein MMC22_001130 [Lobaria immixta]|nr:hypothetical protein [Lobaria immixta]